MKLSGTITKAENLHQGDKFVKTRFPGTIYTFFNIAPSGERVIATNEKGYGDFVDLEEDVALVLPIDFAPLGSVINIFNPGIAGQYSVCCKINDSVYISNAEGDVSSIQKTIEFAMEIVSVPMYTIKPGTIFQIVGSDFDCPMTWNGKVISAVTPYENRTLFEVTSKDGQRYIVNPNDQVFIIEEKDEI